MTNDLYVPLRWALIASLFSPLLMWLWHFAHLPSTLAQAQPVQTVQWQNQTPTQTPLQTPPQTTKPLPIANSTTVNNTGKHSPTTTPTNIPTGNAKGIDVSHYQGKIHWPSVAQTGIHFAYAKATGGDTFVDPMFKTNWYELRRNSRYRCSYHFYLPPMMPLHLDKIFSTQSARSQHTICPPCSILK
ncbi:MAG: GH25 family lysozyme [Gammaproteobacteria bacterium]